jgi:hypothetical protein
MGRHKISRRERRANLRDADAPTTLFPLPAPVQMSVAPPEFDTDMTSVDVLRIAPYTPPAPVADPLFDPEFPVTESAVMAHDCGNQYVLRLRCGGPGPSGDGCLVSFGHGSTRSFAALYGWAMVSRWRRDAFRQWTCPECQMLPTYRTAAGLSPLGHDAHEAGEAEVFLAADVHEAAGTPGEFVQALKAAA